MEQLPGQFTEEEDGNHKIGLCAGKRVTLEPSTQNSIDDYYDTHNVFHNI